MPTQQEYNVAKQSQRDLSVLIYVLNHKFQIVRELSGVVLSDSWNIDSTSNIRRTGSLYIVPHEDVSEIRENAKFWLDKYLQVYIGINDIHTNETVYTNMGIYMVNNPTRVFSGTDDRITLNLVDLMAKITGLRYGSLSGYEVQLFQGSDIKDQMVAVLNDCGFYNYVIEIDETDYTTLQNDITVNGDNTYYDILKELAEINLNYQMYFDVYGVFHYEKIPTSMNEPIFIDDDLFKDCIISYNSETDYEKLKNDIIVIGKTHDIENYGGVATYYNSTVDNKSYYSITSATLSQGLLNGIYVGFTCPVGTKGTNGSKININNSIYYDIKNADGSSPVFDIDEEKYYVLLYVETTNNEAYFLFMGGVTPMAEVKDENPNSPFNINSSIGEIKIVLEGGDYDNIISDDLALQRAKWELYTRCRLLDNISITCIPIYWADVNKVIKLTLPYETEPQLYLITKIDTNGGVTGTQGITAMRYYSYYE